ncbi:hypothetical protein BVH78_11945 [Corynebacterium diphtheriae]|nr:hypothetical protein BVH78_11945 [Corynebacterium diphtheriae]
MKTKEGLQLELAVGHKGDTVEESDAEVPSGFMWSGKIEGPKKATGENKGRFAAGIGCRAQR